jgi:hypothetical protein
MDAMMRQAARPAKGLQSPPVPAGAVAGAILLAANLEIRDDKELPLRRALTLEALRAKGILE